MRKYKTLWDSASNNFHVTTYEWRAWKDDLGTGLRKSLLLLNNLIGLEDVWEFNDRFILNQGQNPHLIPTTGT